MLGSEKGVFWKRGLFEEVHCLEHLESLETLEILESPQSVENKEEPEHFLENLEIQLWDSRDFLQRKDPFRDDPSFFGPEDGALPHEEVGIKRFLTSLERQGKTFV